MTTPQDRLRSIAAVTCVEFLENGLVIFGASRIMAGLHLTPEEFALSWTLYGVAAIFMLYKHRWMVERLGYRRFILGSLAGLALGGVLAATATGFIQFALARLLQGACGATFFTAGRMLMNEVPLEARFRGLLHFIGSLLGASAISPLLSALLLNQFGWQAIFWFALPLCLAVASLAQAHLPRETVPEQARSEEHWGWLLWLVAGIFGLQYAIQSLPGATAESSRQLFVIGLGSTLALSLFALRQWRKERPLIDYRALFQWRYLLGLLLYFSGYFMIGASGLLLPILLHEGLGLSMLVTAGILSASMSLSVAGAIGHAMVARQRPQLRRFMLSGAILYGVSCLALSQAPHFADWRWLLLPCLLLGLSIPIFIGPVAFGTFVELPPAVFSHGYQVKNIVRQLGISSSIALATAGLQHFYRLQRSTIPDGYDGGWLEALNGLSGIDGGLVLPLTQACADVFFWLGVGMLPVAVLVSLQKIFR